VVARTVRLELVFEFCWRSHPAILHPVTLERWRTLPASVKNSLLTSP
jgi:hypothetical protein